jgi:hypothetical protein
LTLGADGHRLLMQIRVHPYIATRSFRIAPVSYRSNPADEINAATVG